jgi:hypothetical protein
LQHVYEVRPRKDHRGVDLISDALPFGRLWYGEPDAISNAINYAKFFSRSHDAVIRVYDEVGNVITAQEHAGAPAPAQSLQLYCVDMKERECESSRPFKNAKHVCERFLLYFGA